MKLNLLPAYVAQRKVNRQLAVLMVVLFLVVNAVVGFLYFNAKSELARLQEEKDTLEMEASRADTLVQQAQARLAQVQATLTKVGFIDAILQWNPKYPELYEKIAEFTHPRVRYESMALNSNNQLQITAVTKSVREIGLYLQTMYKCPLLSGVSLTTTTQGFTSSRGGEGGFAMAGGEIGGRRSGPMIAGVAAAGGGGMAPPPPPPGIGVGGMEFSGGTDQGLPRGYIRFQIVALLKEPLIAPSVPGELTGAGGAPPSGPPPAFGGPSGPPPAGGGGRAGGDEEGTPRGLGGKRAGEFGE